MELSDCIRWKGLKVVLVSLVTAGVLSACGGGGGGGGPGTTTTSNGGGTTGGTPAGGGGTGSGTGGTTGTGTGSPAPKPAVGLPTAIKLTPIASGFTHPTVITHAGDGSGRIFVVEQGGLVKILRNGVVAPTPFLDVTNLVTTAGPEQGLLGLAFPPGFAARGSFYVNYTNRVGVGNTVIARFGLTNDPDQAASAAPEQILTFAQPFQNHNGGQLAFGPDNLLYIGSGDGGSSGDPMGNGQNLSALLGKILRVDVLAGATPYAVPQGNPFGNEIWAYGLRNPWRFSFDRATGDLYLADVGENSVEEIDHQPAGRGAGANYGWNIMEGDQCFGNSNCDPAGITLPVAVYRHGSGDCSVTGGYVYRGSVPALQGTYFYGDFCSGRIWGLKPNGSTWENGLITDTSLSISTFGEDDAGELYVADYAQGVIYQVGAP